MQFSDSAPVASNKEMIRAGSRSPSAKGEVLHAIGLAWPTRSEAVIHSVAPGTGDERLKSVELLGSNVRLEFEQKTDELHMRLSLRPPSKYAYARPVKFVSASH